MMTFKRGLVLGAVLFVWACGGQDEQSPRAESGGSTGMGGSTGAGGVSCSSMGGAPSRTFCYADAECSSAQRCDTSTCVSSSCSCFNGVLGCTADCRHACVAR